MSIFKKTLELLENYRICPHCIGRLFSLLGTSTTNIERGKALLLSLTLENHRKYLSGEQEVPVKNLNNIAINANFNPALEVLKKEGVSIKESNTEYSCYLCENLFSNLDRYVEEGIRITSDYEFKSFLVGCNVKANIINREDKIKVDFNILEAESFKTHFNREIGKILQNKLNREVEFAKPDLVLVYHLDLRNFTIELLLKSLFIFGRYQKLIRGIPQTHWDCRKCRGAGCEDCQQTGKQYPSSVEELITPLFVQASKAGSSKFHGAGREDIDVRMLGKGRPFILELKMPKRRSLELKELERNVNEVNIGKVMITNLRKSSKSEVKELKLNAENTKKSYKALCESMDEITSASFETVLQRLQTELVGEIIQQRTPVRVSHRRADIVRQKKIYEILGKYLNDKQFEFQIVSQGGTYVKELISGDNGRTKPSLSDFFGTQLKCVELDVIEILS